MKEEEVRLDRALVHAREGDEPSLTEREAEIADPVEELQDLVRVIAKRRGPLPQHLGQDRRPVLPQRLEAAPEDEELGALHVTLHEVGRDLLAESEVVQAL